MNWLFPSVFVVGAAAALATLALHFIARSRPLAEPLPTARFVPRTAVQARTRSTALSDVLLLAMRVLAIVALTAGAAGPVLQSSGRVARVIVVDRSRAVASIAQARDSAAAYARVGDELVVFDSAAVRSATTLDSVAGAPVRGSLSAGLAAAVRAGAYAAEHADSVEIILVSPFAREETDDATFKIRDSWPGRIRLVALTPAPAILPSNRIDVSGSANDAVFAGLALMPTPVPQSVRVVRGRPTAADSAWASAGARVLVLWPEGPAAAVWARRPVIDTIGGVVSEGGSLVAAFPRPWTLAGAAIARWSDGEPAAVEHRLGDGCVRDVAILIDPASDIALRAPFRAFARGLVAPCGGAFDTRPVSDSALRLLAGGSSMALAATLRDHAVEVSHATPWLLALGALLLIAELAVRRGSTKLA